MFSRSVIRSYKNQSLIRMHGEFIYACALQILKKIYGEGRDTMHYVTSILNEWGQFLTTVVVASETEDCYRRLASGLVSRFKRANAPAPKLLYTDNNCCR